MASSFIFLFIWRLLPVPVETTEGKHKLNRLQLNAKKKNVSMFFYRYLRTCKYGSWRNSSIHLITQAKETKPRQRDYLKEAGKKLARLPCLNKKEGKKTILCLRATRLVSFGESAVWKKLGEEASRELGAWVKPGNHESRQVSTSWRWSKCKSWT